MFGLVSLLLSVGIVLGVAVWIRSDWRYHFRWKEKRERLRREGRWAELRAYLDRSYHTRRPFVRIFRGWSPGAAAGEYAIELQQLGDDALALEIVDRAIRVASGARDERAGQRRRNQERILMAALSGKALILDSLGRYDNARQLVDTINALDVPRGGALSAVALAELHAGRVDEAVSIARTILKNEPKTDQARSIASRALATKGAFEEALAVLDSPVSDGIGFDDRSHDLHLFKEAAESEERRRARYAGHMQPSRLLAIARVHLAADNPIRALEVLDRCSPLIGTNATLAAFHQPLLARAWALRGDATKADQHLSRMWELIRAHPNRARDCDGHSVAGVSALELGRLDQALSHLGEAMRAVKHPIERHGLHFHIAQTHAAAGRTGEAVESYRAVIADGFATRFHERALAALSGH
jgi:tetratricopeptide (TPR) repeat protein